MTAHDDASTSSVQEDPTSPSSEHVGVRELGHVVLYVRNVERSAKFYRDVLGWRQLQPRDPSRPRRSAMFSGGRTHHELLLLEVGEDATPIPTGRRVGMYHFGLKVGDSDAELAAMLERLRSAGVSLVGATDHGVTHSLYLLDPDGNELELYVDVPGADWNDGATVFQSPKPLELKL